MRNFRVGIIGCGRISYKHVQAIILNKSSIQLVAVCDIEPLAAEIRCKEYLTAGFVEPKVYTDYKEMLDNEQLDIVAIATESGLHAEIALYCLRCKVHILVEKPMALSINDAENMIEMARKNNVKLCVTHQNRFNPTIQKLREAIEQKRFGKIISGTARILWNRDETYYKQASWRGTYSDDGGCLMNQCIHNIDLLQWMLGGDVEWINGVVDNYLHQYIEAEDYGSIQIRFSNGAIGNVEGTVCTYPSNLEETLTIIGEKGTVIVGGLAVNEIKIWRFNDNIDNEELVKELCNTEVQNVYGNGHSLLYKDFIDAIKEDRKPYISGEDGKIALQIILAAYKSSKEERRISWESCKNLKTLDGGIK